MAHLLFLLFSVFTFSKLGLADNLSQEQQKALNQVMSQLTNPTLRAEELKNNIKGQESDRALKDLGGEYSEEIYQLAAQIMENLVREAQGDPDKMQQILEQAHKNPEAFANRFSEDQKRKLKDLAKKIEKRRSKPLP